MNTLFYIGVGKSKQQWSFQQRAEFAVNTHEKLDFIQAV